MGGIEDLIDSRITAGDNRKTLNRVSGAKLASEKATEAKERAEESIEEAASKLGFIDFQSLISEDKLSGELPGVYIRNIAAEKILAGDVDAEYLNVRGRINIGPVMLNPEGITLPTVGDGEDPTSNVARKIKPSGSWGSMEFAQGPFNRGPRLAANGTVDTDTEGRIHLEAKTWAGASSVGNSTASLTVRSTRGGRGIVTLQNGTDFRVNGVSTFQAGITQEPWQVLNALNGWYQVFGSPIQQRLTSDKSHIELRGALEGGGSVGGAMFFLPVGRRPPYDRQYVVAAAGGWARINVNAAGSVAITQSPVSNPGFIHLSGVVFEL